MSVAEGEVRAGLDQLQAVLADARVARLAAQQGLRCDYVEDYDTGRVALARVTLDGVVTWGPFEPRP
jgi:hypothetical protein